MALRKSLAVCLMHLAKAIIPLIASLWTLGPITSQAADMQHKPSPAGAEIITIVGDISPGDAERFRTISKSYNKAAVILSSDGGDVMAALEIGKIIRIAGYSTIVTGTSSCASSCALIWLAGSTRFLQSGGRVGFHAVYRNANGQAQESGSGNALVGNYLTLLNLSERAIYFATKAGPNQISWLTSANKADAEIEFIELPIKRGSLQVVPPPIQTVHVNPAAKRLPVITKYPTSKLPAFNKISADEWILYRTNKDGSQFYYKSNSVFGNFDLLHVWVETLYSDSSFQKKRKDYYYSLVKVDLKCKTQEYDVPYEVDYNSYGSISNTSRPPEPDFEPIAPGSVTMDLWDRICGAQR